MIDLPPDDDPVAALTAAALEGDDKAYLDALLRTSLVMPTEPGRQRWAAVPIAGHGTFVVAFSSEQALNEAPVATGHSIVWPVLDLLHAWPDPAWSLMVDGGRPTQVVFAPDAVAALAERAVAEYPVDAALRAARRDPDAYLNALLPAEVVVPMLPTGSPSRDLSDPEFAWWRVTDTSPGEQSSPRGQESPKGPPGGQGSPGAPGGRGGHGGEMIVLFSSPVRLRTRLGDVPWLLADFLGVLEHWPDGAAAVVDPDHHIGAVLPAGVMRRAQAWARDRLWEAEQEARRVLGGDVYDSTDEERVRQAREAILRLVSRADSTGSGTAG